MEKRNVTITLDDEVADWVRIEAARCRKSVSRYLGDLLRERMENAEAYGTAMVHFLSAPTWLPAQRGPLPKREELYDRHVLR